MRELIVIHGKRGSGKTHCALQMMLAPYWARALLIDEHPFFPEEHGNPPISRIRVDVPGYYRRGEAFQVDPRTEQFLRGQMNVLMCVTGHDYEGKALAVKEAMGGATVTLIEMRALT